MYCRFCGKEIPDDAKFCSICGKELAYKPEEETTQEVKEEKKEDPKFKKFKSDYSKGALACILLYIALNSIRTTFLTIGYIIVTVIFMLRGGTVPPFNNIFDLSNIILPMVNESYFIIIPIMHTIGYVVGCIAAIIIASKIVYGKNNENKVNKNIKRLTLKELLIIIPVTFAVWGIGVGIGNFPSFFFSVGGSGVEIIFGNHIIIYLAQVMIGAPIIEELVFRKLLIDKIAPHGEGIAIVASALLFGLMHGNLGQFFLAFFLGIVFAIVYIKTRNIKYTMCLHFMINTVASLPEIFGLAGIDITIIWYIIIASLTLIGIIVAIIFRKSDILKVNKECEFDGYLIHKAVLFEILFIVLFVGIGQSVISQIITALI
ncbi:MAG: CPBP family intramembrane metalloprotease, partial [Bacilli bacterium]|nr:CPBP family intramembrane metalloprotease [Bacilli bacterium]